MEFGIVIRVIEFVESQVLEKVSRGIPDAPAISGKCILVPDDGGSARERKLQIGHMHAADINVVCLDETVAGIVDAETTQYVDCGNQHPATAAAGIVDRYDLVLIGLSRTSDSSIEALAISSET